VKVLGTQNSEQAKPSLKPGLYYWASSGKKHTASVTCPLKGNQCPVLNAVKLHYTYLEKLRDVNDCQKIVGAELAMAKFVKEIADRSPPNSKGNISAADVWKSLLPRSGNNGSCQSYADTELKHYIESREQKIQQYVTAAETAAKNLVSCIKDAEFQKHLLKAHARKDKSGKPLDFLTTKEALDFYDVQSDSKAKIRDLDHLAAVLTEHLGATDEGRKFLAQIIDENALSQMLGFADVWGYIGSVKSAGEGAKDCLEPVGKLLFNIMPVITGKINNLIIKQGKKTIDEVMNDPGLKQLFNFLDKKFGLSISGFLKDRAESLGKRAKGSIAEANAGRKWNTIIDWWQKQIENTETPEYKALSTKHSALKTINGAWLNITLDSVSLCISISKIATDFKEAGIKDWLGAVSGLTGLAKTMTDTYSASLTVKSFDCFGDDAVAMSLKAEQAAKYAKNLGVVTAVLGAVICVVDGVEGIQRKDWQVISMNAANLALAAAGIYAVIAEAAILSGVLVIAGLVLAILMAVILDPPVIDYLEDTIWGKNQNNRIKLEDTIKEFYKQMFKIRISYYPDSWDKTQSYIEIESGALSDSMPVYITISPEEGSQGSKNEQIFAGSTSVNGKGLVKKDDASWVEGWPFYPKRIRIYRFWEVFTINASKKHTIKAGIDTEAGPDTKIDSMALNTKVSGQVFDVNQAPILRDALTGSECFFPGQQAIIGLKIYVVFKSGNMIPLNIYTLYAKGCTVDITAKEPGLFSSKTLSTIQSIPITGDKTVAQVPLPPPPADNYYELICDVSLFQNGRKISSISVPQVRVATQAYLQKNGARF
jgi:hypothetical protein